MRGRGASTGGPTMPKAREAHPSFFFLFTRGVMWNKHISITQKIIQEKLKSVTAALEFYPFTFYRSSEVNQVLKIKKTNSSRACYLCYFYLLRVLIILISNSNPHFFVSQM